MQRFLRYVKRPIEVGAYKWNGVYNKDVLKPNPVGTAKQCELCGISLAKHGLIESLDGVMVVCPGDYIIRGVEGEIYPCKPSIFEKTYNKVAVTRIRYRC